MKRMLLLIVSLFVFQGLMNGQAVRKVLIEEGTNASCGPCATQNPAFNTLIHGNSDNVVAIKYQWYFPGYDPMHEDNPDEAIARVAYYGIDGVPTAAIDGVVPDDSYGSGIGGWDVVGGGYAGGPYGFNQAVLNYAQTQTTPIEMQLDHNLSADLTSITIDVKIKNVSPDDFTMTTGKLQVVLIEKELVFPFPPGNNGEVDFSDVMKKMYPDQNGTALTTIAAGDSVEFQMMETLPSYVYKFDELAVVAFVQDDATKEVWQAEISNPKAITESFVGIGVDAITVGPTDLCDAKLTPMVQVTNNGDVDVTSFDVAYVLDGGSPVVEAWTGTLTSGSNITVDFPEISLAAGNSGVEYFVSNINGGTPTEINYLDNLVEPESYVAFSAVASQTEIMDGHEDTEVGNPDGTIVDAPLGSAFLVVRRSDLTNNAGDPVGGYGNSQKSIWINFYNWNTASVPSTGTMTYDKVDLSSVSQAQLIFDRAAGGYQGTADQIQVLASTDCGSTWEVLWDKAGSDLATGNINATAFFYPAANEWVTDTVNLDSYAGNADLQIQFRAISSYGNCAWLDNINLSEVLVGTNDPVNLLENVKVFPNPTTDIANIEFSLIEGSDVDIKVYDLTGKLVTVLAENKNFGAGKFIQTWEGAKDAGVYLVKIKTNQGEITQKVTVF